MVQLLIQNDRLLNGPKGLASLCSELELMFVPEQNILDTTVFTAELACKLQKTIEQMPTSNKKEIEKKKDAESRLNTIAEFVASDRFSSISETELPILRQFLRNYFPHQSTNILDVCEQAYDEIIETARLDWPDALDKQPYVNAWWCFAEVSSKLDRPIFFAEAESIGYKRTKRPEQIKPNDLYIEDEDGYPVPDKEEPRSILGYYKSGNVNNISPITSDALMPDIKAFYLSLKDIGRTRSFFCSKRIFQEEAYSKEKRLIEIGKMLTLEYGKPLKESKRVGKDYPVVGSNGIVGYHDQYLIEGPCIVIGRKGGAGEITYCEQPCWPIDTTFYVKLKPGININLKALAYLLKYAKLQEVSLQKAVPGLNRFDAYKRKIPIIDEEVELELLKRLEEIELEEKKLKKMRDEVNAKREGIDDLLKLVIDGQSLID